MATIDLPKGNVSGYIPAGWYPIAVAEQQGRLIIASSKGLGSRYRKAKEGFKVTGSVGTVQFIEPAQMQPKAERTRKWRWNNGWVESSFPRGPDVSPCRFRSESANRRSFKHVIFIIKENHTYDSTLGDMKEGNGAADLCLFGEEVTPNQHALARQWVLLDNTYTSGTNSADGHQWTVSGVANAYMEQNFHSAHSRSAIPMTEATCWPIRL